jgi:hypothetical protein
MEKFSVSGGWICLPQTGPEMGLYELCSPEDGCIFFLRNVSIFFLVHKATQPIFYETHGVEFCSEKLIVA